MNRIDETDQRSSSEHHPSDKASPSESLIGPVSGAAIVAASMIGAGVYTTSGFSLASLGSPGWVLLAWLVAGIIAICGATCYAALAEQMTESGGEYLFLSRVIHPAAGMVAGWVSLLAGFTGAMAFAAKTLETYGRSWLPDGMRALPEGTLAVGMIAFAALVHSSGLRRGTLAQNGLVIAKLVLILIFVVVSLSMVGQWHGVPWAPDESSAATSTNDSNSWDFVLAFASALMWISLSYSGFNAAVYMTSEIKNPKRNVPRALIWGTLGVTCLYLILNAIFVCAPKSSQVAGAMDVANVAALAVSDMVTKIGVPAGRLVAPLVNAAILVGLATSVFALTQTGPRIYQKMTSEGFLPHWLFGEGVVRAIWIQAVLAAMVVQIASLQQQLDYLGFTLSVCAALCGSLVFVVPGHFLRSRGWAVYPTVPIIYVGGTLLIATLAAVRAPFQALIGLGTLLVGVVAYYLMPPTKPPENQ